MISAALKNSPEPRPMTLAELFDKAGLTEYADWSHEVFVTPSGNPAFIPRPYQISGLNHLAAYLPRVSLYDDPGCLSCDTEYLSPTGWKRIDEYDGGMVMQATKEGVAKFVTPISYVKKPCREFLHFNSKTVDQRLSREHRVLYVNKLNQRLVRPAQEIYQSHCQSKDGWAGSFITTFTPELETSIPLTDAELRVMVAVLGDGAFNNTGHPLKCKIEVVKERKKERLRNLLNEAGIPFEEREYRRGSRSFFFKAPLRSKTYQDFWAASLRQLQIIIGECLYWDGHMPTRARDGGEFYSSDKASADFIQYAASACGIRATLRVKEPGAGYNKKPCYSVYFCRKSTTTHIRNKHRIQESIRVVPSEDGYKYCFEVPSTFFVIRRNGKVVITGNTGKSLQMQAFMIWLFGLGNKAAAIMPPVLVPQFLESFHRDFPGIERYVRISAIHGERDERQKQIDLFESRGWPDILLMSYPTFLGKQRAPRRSCVSPKKEAELNELTKTNPEEAARIRQELASAATIRIQEEDRLYQWYEGVKITAYNFRSEALNYLGYNLLVCDEAHELKKPSSDIHRAVKMFVQAWEGDNSNGLVLATGSPIETNVEDAYGLISLVDPSRYGSARAFDAEHCILVPGVRFRKVEEYVNLDYLYQSLYARGRRITKRQAFPDMPARVITEVEVNLNKDHKDLYKKLVNEQVLELEDRLIDATQQQRMYQYVQQILLCPERFSDKPFKDNAVIAALDEIIASLGGRKLIVFAWYQESIDKLLKYYAKFNPVAINGTVTGAVRERAKQTFIKDDKCLMLIANAQSGGVGIDGFQHVCSYAVFAEIYPHPGGFEQAVGRLERSGQTEAVNIFLLVPHGTIAVKLRNDLCRKESNANAAVRDKKTLIADMLGEGGTQGTLT
jgi:hypothetical protein